MTERKRASSTSITSDAKKNMQQKPTEQAPAAAAKASAAAEKADSLAQPLAIQVPSAGDGQNNEARGGGGNKEQQVTAAAGGVGGGGCGGRGGGVGQQQQQGGGREQPRKFSPSEPLLPDSIAYIREQLRQANADYRYEELPHVFVVLGASVFLLPLAAY